jgi:hypothetical protein
MKHLILLILFSCATRHIPIEVTELPVPEVVSVPSETSAATLPPFLTVTDCIKCTSEQLARINESTALLNQITASQCFKDKVLAYSFTQTDKSNEEIYRILSGGGVRVQTEIYYTLKRVLGYTIEGVNKIWINRRTMMNWSALDLASLLGHEGSHKLGMNHTYNYVPGREHSVSYALNEIIEECGK